MKSISLLWPFPIFLLWLAAMATLALLYLTVPPSPDQSQFDWMAYSAIQGLPYYAGSFDMNWPGAIWLHELGIRLFGVHPWTWRLTDFLLTLAFTGAGAIFLTQAGWQRAGILFLMLYPPLYVTAGGWMAGQRDIIAAGFLLVACAASFPGGRYEKLGTLFAGIMVAVAVLIRPTYLSFLLGLLVLEYLPLATPRPRQLSRGVRSVRILAGFALGISGALMVGSALGNLDDWYEQSILFSLSMYVGAWPQNPAETLQTLFVESWHWIGLLALIGMTFWIRRDGLSHGLFLAVGIAATGALSFAVQGKGFGYHLGGVLLVFVLFIAVCLEALTRLLAMSPPGKARVSITILLALVAGLVVLGTANKLNQFVPGVQLLSAGSLGPQAGHDLTEKERRAIVELIQAGSDPHDTVIVYGTNYELPYRAERVPSYRFFTPAADQIRPDFVLYDAWVAEIEAALTTRRPAFVILSRRWIEGDAEKPEAKQKDKAILSRLLAHLETGYDPVFETETLIVYRTVMQ